MSDILFYVFGAVALASGVVVVAQRNPVYSAFALIVTLCSLSAIYGLLGSPFIAVLQIVVYAGAIMVLFLFVLMLLNVKREGERPGGGALRVLALGLAGVLVFQIGSVLMGARFGPSSTAFDASTRGMALQLFSPTYLYVFEATSVLILAALVGAIVLAKKEP